jgi:hypothetical protein
MGISKYFFFLILLGGCATKYIVPGNRFLTPESQGGNLRSHFEFQQSSATQLTADLTNASIKDGVTQQVVARSGFLFGTSLYESADFFWTHTGGANSLLGLKLQLIGASKAANGTGHLLAVAASLGANEHETDGSNTVEFELSGKEFNLLYGYRFSENILAYSNLSHATYNFLGKVRSSDPLISGLGPEYETVAIGLYGGMQVDLGSFYGKAECGYQQLTTTYTNAVNSFLFGYSVGVSW